MLTKWAWVVGTDAELKNEMNPREGWMASARWLFNWAADPRKHRVEGQMLSVKCLQAATAWCVDMDAVVPDETYATLNSPILRTSMCSVFLSACQPCQQPTPLHILNINIEITLCIVAVLVLTWYSHLSKIMNVFTAAIKLLQRRRKCLN